MFILCWQLRNIHVIILILWFKINTMRPLFEIIYESFDLTSDLKLFVLLL